MKSARILAGKFLGRAFALAAFCGATGALAEPTDGFYWPSGWYHYLNTFQSQTRYWEENIVPADGGVAYWTGTQAGDISFGSAVALRGLDFGKVQLVSASGAERPRILSAGLTLTGDDAFISGTGWGSNASGRDRYICVNATIGGTGSNTLAIRGPGFLTVNSPFANFGTIVAAGGDVITTATSGRLYATGGATALRGGILRWAPSLAAGASASATLGAVTYGSGHNVLNWRKGSGDAATLTIDSLASEGAGSTLWIRPSGGTSTLGGTEKLMVATPPALVNGILDPGVVTHDETSESMPLSFLTYDAAKGVVPYPSSSLVPLADATATDVAVLSASNTSGLSVPRRVWRLKMTPAWWAALLSPTVSVAPSAISSLAESSITSAATCLDSASVFEAESTATSVAVASASGTSEEDGYGTTPLTAS